MDWADDACRSPTIEVPESSPPVHTLPRGVTGMTRGVNPCRGLIGVVWLVMVVGILSCGGIGQATPLSATRGSRSLLLNPGTSRRSLSVSGWERSYLVHVPEEFDAAAPAAVVLVFHGGGGNAHNAAEMTGYDAQSEASGFLAVYPNGTGRLRNMLLTWNAGECCGYAQEEDIDDVAFVRALIEDLASLVPIDRHRIYATGMSNGAIMSYRLACELSDEIAAIAPVAATQNIESCRPTRPMSVVHFHGTADEYAPYEGGTGEQSISRVDFAPVRQTIEFWLTFNRCPTEPVTQQSRGIIHERYAPCDQGTAVELYTLIGGGHVWPGGQKLRAAADTPTQEISATRLSWEFFSAHPLP